MSIVATHTYIHQIKSIKFDGPARYYNSEAGGYWTRELYIESEAGAVRFTLFADSAEALEIFQPVPVVERASELVQA